MKYVIPAAAHGNLFRRPAAWNAESKAGGLLFFSTGGDRVSNMRKWVKKLFFIVFSAIPTAAVLAGNGELPRNFHEVDPANRICRSAQPGRREFEALEKRGFRTVLNLRNFHTDRRMLRDLKLEECAVPCNAGSMTEEHVYDALRIIRDKPKPLLIHCWHGSDRTGTVVAAFRIVFNGQEVETAIAEMREEKYGHHADIYGNLPELLRAIDWGKMRNRLQTEDLFVEPFKPEQVLRIDYAPEPFRVTAGGNTAENPEAALALVQEEWRKKPYRVALLVFDRQPGNPLYEPFAAKLNRLPELEEAVRIDAVPDETNDASMRTLCRRVGLEEGTARAVRAVPHRMIWTPPAGTPSK